MKKQRMVVAVSPMLGGGMPTHKKGEKHLVTDNIGGLGFQNRLLRRAVEAEDRARKRKTK